MVAATRPSAQPWASRHSGSVNTKKPSSRPKTGSPLANGWALRNVSTVSQWTLARSPEATAMTSSTIGRNRRMSGSITTRPGRPSWSSSSHSTSGAAVRAAKVRLAHRKTSTPTVTAVKRPPCSPSVVQKTPL